MKLIQPLSEEFLYGSPEFIHSSLFRLKFMVRDSQSVIFKCKLRTEAAHAKNKKFKR